MQTVRLDQHSDFQSWRDHARSFCAARIPPAHIRFVPPDSDDNVLDFGAELTAETHRPVTASRDFLERAERVACHRDPSRYDRLYQLLWRLQDQPDLMRNAVDKDVTWLVKADQSVRRDRHKMHAFVRFRKVGETEAGREQFMAWFEPDHFIVDLATPFFTRRFPNMDWAIVTPYRSAIWDGQTLHFGPGGRKSDVPETDAVEAQWKTYFTSIFNPSRLKLSAMTAEMPKKYWRNLPEAELIPSLIQTARTRETTHMNSLNQAPNPIAEKALYQNTSIAPVSKPETLDSLSEQLQICRQCPLWEQATQPVPGEGPMGARLMIVGEQPGDQEDLAGKPFIGPAGAILDQALAAASLSREEAYITNAVKHFKYDVRSQRRIHKNPTLSEIRACNHWLQQEIDLVDPDIILCLGKSATRAVSGQSLRLRDMRGQVLTRSDGRKFLVTSHPSYVLRTQRFEEHSTAFPDMVSDLQKLAPLLAA